MLNCRVASVCRADSEPMAVETLIILLYNFCRDPYVGTHSWTVLMDINPGIIKHSENMIKWPRTRFFQTPILYSPRHSGILAFHNIAANIIFTYKQWCRDLDSSNYYHSLVKRYNFGVWLWICSSTHPVNYKSKSLFYCHWGRMTHDSSDAGPTWAIHSLLHIKTVVDSHHYNRGDKSLRTKHEDRPPEFRRLLPVCTSGAP